MKPFLLPFLLFILFILPSCSPVKYFVVRHAEKAVPSNGVIMNTPNDPPLSAAGQERAIQLLDELKNEHIRFIYSTNTIRTISTAKPLNDFLGSTKIELYNTKDSFDFFIEKLRALKKGNVLIVGHSNTVDDIVNKLCKDKKVPGDLPDSEYDNLYIITKKGKKMKFENKTFGAPTN